MRAASCKLLAVQPRQHESSQTCACIFMTGAVLGCGQAVASACAEAKAAASASALSVAISKVSRPTLHRILTSSAPCHRYPATISYRPTSHRRKLCWSYCILHLRAIVCYKRTSAA